MKNSDFIRTEPSEFVKVQENCHRRHEPYRYVSNRTDRIRGILNETLQTSKPEVLSHSTGKEFSAFVGFLSGLFESNWIDRLQLGGIQLRAFI